MSLYALHLGQVNMVLLPEPVSGTKRSKQTTTKYPCHKSFGLPEVLIWVRNGVFRDGHYNKIYFRRDYVWAELHTWKANVDDKQRSKLK